MSTTTNSKTEIPKKLDARVLARVLEEGYGPGAWHGADLKAALADVAADAAFWRPAPGRHNIAEIALHHAYCARAVRGQLTGNTPEAFVLDGEDWFPLSAGAPLDWAKVQAAVETEQARVATVLAGLASGQVGSPLGDVERFDLVLGLACHAVYHAGQVQLLKRLRAD
jgi:hypothetical protein